MRIQMIKALVLPARHQYDPPTGILIRVRMAVGSGARQMSSSIIQEDWEVGLVRLIQENQDAG